MRACPGMRRPPAAGAGSNHVAWPLALLLCGFAMLLPRAASAVPAYAQQTGQPCAACHVGAFGPQLKQYGRDFKLNGYVASAGGSHGPPLAASVQGSFTHTDNAQPGPAALHFAANNNFAVDQV